MTEEKYPDIFADGVTVSSGPYGIAFTFYLSDPLAGGAGAQPGAIVARIRVGPALAEAMADNIKQGLTKIPDRAKREE